MFKFNDELKDNKISKTDLQKIPQFMWHRLFSTFGIIRKNNIELFASKKFKEIVTNDGNCLKTLRDLYGFKVSHVTELIAKYVNKLPVKYEEAVSYYDPVHLNVYNEPRKILNEL